MPMSHHWCTSFPQKGCTRVAAPLTGMIMCHFPCKHKLNKRERLREVTRRRKHWDDEHAHVLTSVRNERQTGTANIYLNSHKYTDSSVPKQETTALLCQEIFLNSFRKIKVKHRLMSGKQKTQGALMKNCYRFLFIYFIYSFPFSFWDHFWISNISITV